MTTHKTHYHVIDSDWRGPVADLRDRIVATFATRPPAVRKAEQLNRERGTDRYTVAFEGVRVTR